MTFAIKAAPGHIEDHKLKARSIDLILDVTADQYQDALDVIFPGFRFALAGAAGKNDVATGEKAAAFAWVVSEQLPPISVNVTDTIGEVIIDAVNAKVKGKPTLRVSRGVERVWLPITFIADLTDDAAKRLRMHLGDVDVFIDIGVSQMDIGDAIEAERLKPAPAPTTAKRGKKKETVKLDNGFDD